MAEDAVRIPRLQAFGIYVSQGESRSYRRVAEQLGVSRRGIERVAKVDRWPVRLKEVEETARQRAEEELVESLTEMKRRQLQSLRVVNARALEA